MTGMGEDVYTDRSTALDALTEESQRMGMYGDAPDVEKMVEAAARAMFDLREDDGAHWSNQWDREFHINDARAALESLGIPLSVLAALRAGKPDSLLTTWECLGVTGGWVPPSHPLHPDNPGHGTRKVPVGVVDALRVWHANPTDDNAYMLRLFCDSWKEDAR